MKSFIKYIAAGVIALSCVSCLDLTPKDQLSDPDLWSKPGDFENLANKFYDWIPTFDRTYGDWHADKSSDLLRDKGGTNTLIIAKTKRAKVGGTTANLVHNYSAV